MVKLISGGSVFNATGPTPSNLHYNNDIATVITGHHLSGPLQLLILDVKYFENPRQKKRNIYCLARKREMEKNSVEKGKTWSSSLNCQIFKEIYFAPPFTVRLKTSNMFSHKPTVGSN